MATVLHLRKELIVPPVERPVGGVDLRSMRMPDDINAWLDLRKRVSARLTPPVREWTSKDFAVEMLQKPWWRDDWSWVAMTNETSMTGCVTLGIRAGGSQSIAVVHWLLVDPCWRRRGVGRLLMSKLETAAWREGWPEVQLETHAGWTEAVAFYHSIGYAAVRDRSSR
jgi:GNAT superfamily N-acetyltransferase